MRASHYGKKSEQLRQCSGKVRMRVSGVNGKCSAHLAPILLQLKRYNSYVYDSAGKVLISHLLLTTICFHQYEQKLTVSRITNLVYFALNQPTYTHQTIQNFLYALPIVRNLRAATITKSHLRLQL